MDNYDIISEIGEGGFGKVYMINDNNGDHYAMKTTCQKISAPMFNELVMNKYLEQQGIPVVKFNQVICHNNELNIIEELWDGDLSDQEWSESQLLHIFRWLLDTISLVHSKGVVLNDLKHGNILYRLTGEQLSLTLCDFGLCETKLNHAIHGLMDSTYNYIPLDVLQSDRISWEQAKAKDYWAAGLSILNSHSSFREQGEVFSLPDCEDKNGSYAFMTKALAKWDVNRSVRYVENDELRQLLVEVLTTDWTKRTVLDHHLDSNYDKWNMNFELLQFSIDFFDTFYYETYCQSDDNIKGLYIFLILYGSYLTHKHGIKHMLTIHYQLYLLYGRISGYNSGTSEEMQDDIINEFLPYAFWGAGHDIYNDIHNLDIIDGLANDLCGNIMGCYNQFIAEVDNISPGKWLYDNYIGNKHSYNIDSDDVINKLSLVSSGTVANNYEAWKLIGYDQEDPITDYHTKLHAGLTCRSNPLTGVRLCNMNKKSDRYSYFLIMAVQGTPVWDVNIFNGTYVRKNKHIISSS